MSTNYRNVRHAALLESAHATPPDYRVDKNVPIDEHIVRFARDYPENRDNLFEP